MASELLQSLQKRLAEHGKGNLDPAQAKQELELLLSATERMLNNLHLDFEVPTSDPGLLEMHVALLELRSATNNLISDLQV